jgi:hypothetical protein
MNNDKHAKQPEHDKQVPSVAATQYVVRDRILKLLSEDELARVSTAETAARLTDGDEYIDLEHLETGVRKAGGKTTTAVERALPRKAVAEATWRAILVQLADS